MATTATPSGADTSTPSFVIEAGDSDFETVVIARSRAVPVVVDFWAPWCGPCRVLGPILERLADEQGGAFVLAKVNVDENPALSRRFGVQSIPLVKGFRDGQEADSFTGALPESQIRTWLRRLIPSQADRLAAEAAGLAPVDPEGAIARYRAALEQDPAHQASLLGLGLLLLLGGDPDGAAMLQRIPGYPHTQALVCLGQFLASPERDGDMPAPVLHYATSAGYVRAGQWEDALKELLSIIQAGQSAGQVTPDLARRTVLALFSVMGESDPLVPRYRRLLANALF
jgi:putative thioredoxin